MTKAVVGVFSFDWDPRKDAENLANHGLSFELAITIWFHPELFVDVSDGRFDYREDRWIAIGPLPSDRRLIVVVAYTDRDNDIRIISARFADKSEEKAYRKRLHKGKP